jgi:hypothetical protein
MVEWEVGRVKIATHIDSGNSSLLFHVFIVCETRCEGGELVIR